MENIVSHTLGKNFFGVEDWSSLYGVAFTDEQLKSVEEFPWSEDVLNAPCPFHNGKTVKETHFGFLGLDKFKGDPLTIMRWQKIHPATGQPRLYSYGTDSWYRDQEFATQKTCQLRWHLMPLEIVPDSTDKSYEKQQGMVPEGYEIPLAVEEVAKDMLYFRKNGVYLNQTRYGRCQDTSSDGYRVGVGYFDSYGLGVGVWDDRGRYGIGLAVSRKL